MGGWSYYRLCENLCWLLGSAPGGSLGSFWAQKMGIFEIFIRILRFIWGLVLVSCDSPKDVVSGKILVFGTILDFLGVNWNWAQKWTKTENFGYLLFVLKHLILKHCSHTFFVLWWATSGPNFKKFESYLGEKGPRHPQKGLLHRHENIWKFLTLEPQMLSWCYLPRLCITIRPFTWEKIWASPIGRSRAWSKNL